MSSPKSTDNKEEKKSGPQYLTLADKKPSLIRETGNESTSARTISTRELSVNLQKTRDGLINLNRKRKRTDGLDTIHGSDSGDESEDVAFTGFGMPGRGKKTTKDGGVDGSSLYDANKQGKKGFGQYGWFGSKEFENVDPNRHQGGMSDGAFGSNVGMSRGKNGKRRRRGNNSDSDDSDMNSDEDHDGKYGGKHRKNGKGGRYGQGFDDKNGEFGKDMKRNKKLLKLLQSQNPKKDGPLTTRIFIDAFLPSLEANRIFPLFNWRCSEQIERASPDYYDRKRKGPNKRLAAVGSTEKCLVEESSGSSEGSTTASTIKKVGEHGSVEEIQGEKEEKLQKIKELQGKGEKKTPKRKDDLRKQRGEQQRAEHTKEGEWVSGKAQDGQEVNRQQAPNTATKAVQKDASAAKKTVQSEVASSPTNQAKSNLDGKKADATGKGSYADKAGVEDDKQIQRMLRSLLGNEELIDFFCEKVISKIAARNDFCGPNCKGICGGLNKPSG